MKEVVNNLERLEYEQLHIVLGMVKDKDISAVLKNLPKNAMYYFCSPDLERALSAEELQLQAALQNLNGDTYSTVSQAYLQAKNNASSNDVIFIGGSTFVVAEVL
ncbi:MAG TPA: bifunctional folylpolyglutamate synthase/dihydrofolate synthase, partial [Pedobacter sp.]